MNTNDNEHDTRRQIEKRKLIYASIMTILVSFQSVYLLFFADKKFQKNHENVVHSSSQVFDNHENKLNQNHQDNTVKPIAANPQVQNTDFSYYYQKFKQIESQISDSSPKSITWEENQARYVIVLRYHQGKVIYAEVMQPDAIPASQAKYWFDENQLLKAELGSGETESAGGRHSAGVTRTSWRVRQHFWFDKQGYPIHIQKDFDEKTLLARYQNCAVCVQEAKMILDNAPADWYQNVDASAFRLP